MSVNTAGNVYVTDFTFPLSSFFIRLTPLPSSATLFQSTVSFAFTVLGQQVAQQILAQSGQSMAQPIGMATTPTISGEEHPNVTRARNTARTSTQAD